MFWCSHCLNYACFLVFFVYDVTWFLTFILFTRGAVEDIRLEAKIKAKDTKKIEAKRPRTVLPRTDPFKAKGRNGRGQGQGLKNTGANVLQKKKKRKKRSSKIFFKQSKSKKSSLKYFFRRFSNFNNSKNAAVLKPRTGQFSRT